jgi:hypothetical protein
MADKSLTPASVVPSANATLIYGTYGATVTAGQAVYADATALDSLGRAKFKLADNNASAATAAMQGIAVNGGSDGQPATICQADPVFTHGLATVAAGDVLVLSATAGGIAPVADLATGNYPVVAMVGLGATTAVLKITAGTVVK